VDGALVLAMILLLVASGYVAGRVHGQYGYRMGFRLGYRQGFVDAERGHSAQTSPSPPSRGPQARAGQARTTALLDLGTMSLARHRARARAASPGTDG
jgi:hypothetical protein